MTLRLGILTTHPIQYQVPWFRALSKEPGIDLEVLYCMLPDANQQGSGFGVKFQWDIPLMDGYRYRVLENRAAQPAVTTFRGCDTPGIASIVRDEPWDAFIVNGWVAKSCLQLLWACRRQGVPCIVRGESNAIRPRAAWKSGIHRALLRQYAAFLAIGSQNEAFYRANGVPQELIFSAPYCVENERFAQAGERLDRSGPFTFLFSGKLIDKKRPLDALEALRRLVEASGSSRYRLLIAGDGELRGACERMASQYNLPVEFLGFVNQSRMHEAYAEADCLLLPSDHGETWGLVVNEAMAAGLPAVVSDQVGCHPDLIVEGATGHVFRCGDTSAMAAKMALIGASRERARDMGRAACQRVNEQYSYRQVVQGTLAALKQVCRPGEPGRLAPSFR